VKEGLFIALFVLHQHTYIHFPYKTLEMFHSLCTSHFRFIIAVVVLVMDSGFASTNRDDARVRRARRKEILMLKRDGGRAVYPVVVSRSGCEYNFCNLFEFVLFVVLFCRFLFYVCADVVCWLHLTVQRRSKSVHRRSAQGPSSLMSQTSGGMFDFFSFITLWSYFIVLV
jgi:hypothetical protein